MPGISIDKFSAGWTNNPLGLTLSTPGLVGTFVPLLFYFFVQCGSYLYRVVIFWTGGYFFVQVVIFWTCGYFFAQRGYVFIMDTVILDILPK